MKNILTPLEELVEDDEELNYADDEDNVALDEESSNNSYADSQDSDDD